MGYARSAAKMPTIAPRAEQLWAIVEIMLLQKRQKDPLSITEIQSQDRMFT
jgi:hypothetical protein